MVNLHEDNSCDPVDLHAHVHSLSVIGAFLLSTGGKFSCAQRISFFLGGTPVLFIFTIGSVS